MRKLTVEVTIDDAGNISLATAPIVAAEPEAATNTSDEPEAAAEIAEQPKTVAEVIEPEAVAEIAAAAETEAGQTQTQQL